MAGRAQDLFTWEERPDPNWIEGLSIYLSLKSLRTFSSNQQPPTSCSLSLSSFLSLTPLLFLPVFFAVPQSLLHCFPSLCSSCFIFLQPPHFIFPFFYSPPSNLSFSIRLSLMGMMFASFILSPLSPFPPVAPLKFWFDCRHNTRRHQCVSPLYSFAFAHNDTDPIHENDLRTIAMAHSIFRPYTN